MRSSSDMVGRHARPAVQQKADGAADDMTKSDFPTGSQEEVADIARRRDHLYKTMGDTFRIRRQSDLTIIRYDPHNRSCTVIQNRGRTLASMGYTISGGERKLHPEEAVFLLESNSATIRVNDVPISVQQSYRLLLETNAVSWAEYLVYTHLKRAGYIVLPFKPASEAQNVSISNNELKRSGSSDGLEASPSEEGTAKKLKEGDAYAATISCEQSNETDVKSPSHSPYPRSLLDCFPDNHGSATMRLPSASKWQRFLPPGIQPTTANEIVVDCQSFSSDTKQKKDKSGRSDPPWVSLRPRHWAPLPRGISSRQSWAEFKHEKERWIARRIENRARHANAGFVLQHAPVHSQFVPAVSDASSGLESQFRIRYDVHLPGSNYSHSLPPSPNHRLVIVDVHRSPMPSPVDMERLKRTVGDLVPIHLAVCDGGQIAFYNSDMIMIPML